MPNTLGIQVISGCVPEVISPEKPALFGIRGMPVRYCAVEVVNKSPDIGLVDANAAVPTTVRLSFTPAACPNGFVAFFGLSNQIFQFVHVAFCA